jgi:hypothetical protein
MSTLEDDTPTIAACQISSKRIHFMQAGQEQHRGYFEDLLQEIDRHIAALTPPR